MTSITIQRFTQSAMYCGSGDQINLKIRFLITRLTGSNSNTSLNTAATTVNAHVTIERLEQNTLNQHCWFKLSQKLTAVRLRWDRRASFGRPETESGRDIDSSTECHCRPTTDWHRLSWHRQPSLCDNHSCLECRQQTATCWLCTNPSPYLPHVPQSTVKYMVGGVA